MTIWADDYQHPTEDRHHDESLIEIVWLAQAGCASYRVGYLGWERSGVRAIPVRDGRQVAAHPFGCLLPTSSGIPRWPWQNRHSHPFLPSGRSCRCNPPNPVLRSRWLFSSRPLGGHGKDSISIARVRRKPLDNLPLGDTIPESGSPRFMLDQWRSAAFGNRKGRLNSVCRPRLPR